MNSVAANCVQPRRLSEIAFHGEPKSEYLRWFGEGVGARMRDAGHDEVTSDENPGLVLHFVDPDRPRPFRRKSQGTFVVGITEVSEAPEDILATAYPMLVKSLSNLFIFITPAPDGGKDTYFITLEQGYYTAREREGDAYFDEVYEHVAPLASTRLVINNEFRHDLPEDLAAGNDRTRSIYDAGKRLDAMGLLPTAFPIQDILSERDMQHVRRLFGLGGLSYGNVSTRQDETSFWMSARGVDKSNLRDVGRDVLLISDYLPEQDAMVVRVPEGVEARSASVDAIEHWGLYNEHPEIGAIVHIHAWMEGIESTRVNYPCGTYELAQEVAELARQQPDPARAVIGLKNHGLTITGRSLEEIFDRIEGRIIRQVPMEP